MELIIYEEVTPEEYSKRYAEYHEEKRRKEAMIKAFLETPMGKQFEKRMEQRADEFHRICNAMRENYKEMGVFKED